MGFEEKVQLREILKMRGERKISGHIPNPVKRNIWQRAKGKCEFKECKSVFGLEFHHINPFSFKAEHVGENIQLRCKIHHQRRGVQMKFIY